MATLPTPLTQYTPHLGLSLFANDMVMVNNMAIIDSAFGSISTGAAPPFNSVQYNNGGVLGGNGDFTFVDPIMTLKNAAATPSTTRLQFQVRTSDGRGAIQLLDSVAGTLGQIFFNTDGGVVLVPLTSSATGIQVNNSGVNISGKGGAAGANNSLNTTFSASIGADLVVNGAKAGTVGISILGSTSGQANLVVQPVAGTPTLTLPTVSGTLALLTNAGTLTAASYVESSTLSPTSAGTAGVTGQIAWDVNRIYVCTNGGIAGSATWKGAALTAV